MVDIVLIWSYDGYIDNSQKGYIVDIKSLYKEKCIIVKKIKEMGDSIYELPFEEFIYHIIFLTPQSYGSKIEKYVSKVLDSDSVPSRMDRGDIVTKDGRYLEVKSSIITDTNDSLNIVQIRPWQNIDGYVINIIDILDDSFVYHMLGLTKDQMSVECKKMNITSAHGTKGDMSDNINVELRIGLKRNSVDYIRWVKEYKINV